MINLLYFFRIVSFILFFLLTKGCIISFSPRSYLDVYIYIFLSFSLSLNEQVCNQTISIFFLWYLEDFRVSISLRLKISNKRCVFWTHLFLWLFHKNFNGMTEVTEYSFCGLVKYSNMRRKYLHLKLYSLFEFCENFMRSFHLKNRLNWGRNFPYLLFHENSLFFLFVINNHSLISTPAPIPHPPLPKSVRDLIYFQELLY